MNVGEMRKLIEGLSDDMNFYIIGGDHEALGVEFADSFVTSEEMPSTRIHYGQFFGDEFLLEDETKVRALVSN